MLNAFKQHLKTLAVDPTDDFGARVRALSDARRAPHDAGVLRRMVLSLPLMAGRVSRWSDDPVMPPSLRRQQKFAQAYLYSPVDFLPEESLGFFGYVDDAYLLASVYESTRRELDEFGVVRGDDDEALRRDGLEGMAVVRRLMPQVAREVDETLRSVQTGGDLKRALDRSAAIGSAR